MRLKDLKTQKHYTKIGDKMTLFIIRNIFERLGFVIDHRTVFDDKKHYTEVLSIKGGEISQSKAEEVFNLITQAVMLVNETDSEYQIDTKNLTITRTK